MESNSTSYLFGGNKIMIYCEKEKGNYVDQEEKCINCIFYLYNENTCDWEN